MDQQPAVSGSGISKPGWKWKQMGSEEKRAAVDDEINKMNRLPQNSNYASHRLRVLAKIKHLMSLQRTISQDEELELLFSGLHL